MPPAAHLRLGRAGEDRAAQWYRQQGYRVVDRNWRCREGELDLVATRGATVVFCEVKTRSSTRFGEPFEAVGPAKQSRVRRLAARWLREHRVRAHEIRFDVASLLGSCIDVIEDAF